MHYGLLPRANRGIFSINELPDLAGKIQVALFNIMQEGDVQIKGYPVRLALDVALVFSANPEDYTARGKIVTPLKDRIGSEIRTHYPETIEEGIAITSQEAWSERGACQPRFRNMCARLWSRWRSRRAKTRRVDKRSGVSQRLPISTMELVISNAERRALTHGEALVLPRVSDLYAALPGITGKLELEYEGEMKGADVVVRELIRTAAGKIYDKYFGAINTQQIEQWFNLGGTVKLDDDQPTAAALTDLKEIQGLVREAFGGGREEFRSWRNEVVAAAEFLLEGMVAHRKLSRNEERGFSSPEKAQRKPERVEAEADYQDWQQQQRRTRRGGLN
jgi:magnesium chelatase subunit I